MQKKLFSIEWPDELGPEWLGKHNLLSCVTSPQHIGEDIDVRILDVTNPPPEPQPVLGGHDL